MVIKSATSLRKDYDEIVKLCTEKQVPVYLTRNGEGEMVIQTIADYERREAELRLTAEMLRREQNRLAGAITYTIDEMATFTEELLSEG